MYAGLCFYQAIQQYTLSRLWILLGRGKTEAEPVYRYSSTYQDLVNAIHRRPCISCMMSRDTSTSMYVRSRSTACHAALVLGQHR